MKRKRIILIIVTCVILLTAVFIVIYKDTIFQRGNPIPYMSKMITLTNDVPYAKVYDDQYVYIMRFGSDKLIKHIEETYQVTFIEQMGSSYFFESAEGLIIAESEVYWRYYSVWELNVSETELNTYNSKEVSKTKFCRQRLNWERRN